jgi:hypothetical protein
MCSRTYLAHFDDATAGNNEIDQPLLDLLQQNIAAAKAADQEKPAEFMQKVGVVLAVRLRASACSALRGKCQQPVAALGSGILCAGS